jgi:hypothetical protein
VFTFDIHSIARGELASAQVFVSTVQTTKVIRALGGLFQCFFADFVFFLDISAQERPESRGGFLVSKLFPPLLWRWEESSPTSGYI